MPPPVTDSIPFLKNIFPPSCHSRVALVGGTVRDMLLGTGGKDMDLVAALSHEELCGLGFRLVEPASAATIYFRHILEAGSLEVTRIEGMNRLNEDLLRRDFTVNAMALGLDGTYSDPFHGEADVKKRLLRACSERTFSDDPLRIFRAFRFASDGWNMTPETEALIRNNRWSDAFRTIPAERFSGELLKAMALGSPERFFQGMIRFDLGGEFLPELFRMPQIPAGPHEHHPEGDLFSHSIQVLQRVTPLSPDPLTRFCAFFHDLGKLATPPALYPRHHGHDHAGFPIAVELCTHLRLPSIYRTALAWTNSLHTNANRWDELRDSSKLKLAEQAYKAGITEILPLVSAADKAGSLPMAGWDTTVRVARMNSAELAIDPGIFEALPIRDRAPYMVQKRVAVLRELRGATFV